MSERVYWSYGEPDWLEARRICDDRRCQIGNGGEVLPGGPLAQGPEWQGALIYDYEEDRIIGRARLIRGEAINALDEEGRSYVIL